MTALFAYPTAASLFLAAMALLAAGGVFWLARRRGPAPLPAWIAIAVLVCAGLLPAAGYLRSFTPYHVLVTVVGPPGGAADAKVWSSVQNESTKVDGGWRIDIPAESVPSDKVVLVWATLDPADLTHSKAVTLGNDHEPRVTIRITGDRSALVGGWVRNRDGKPMNGAVVSLAGEPRSAIVTQMGGDFRLPVNAEEGDQVQIQVTFNGKINALWATAGDKAMVISVDGP
jgi:hypothetical protein